VPFSLTIPHYFVKIIEDITLEIIYYMKLEEAITKRIYALCEERNISPNKLATFSGLPAGSIKSIFYGKSKNPGTRTILDMCQALDISLYDFFDDNLFKDKELEGTY